LPRDIYLSRSRGEREEKKRREKRREEKKREEISCCNYKVKRKSKPYRQLTELIGSRVTVIVTETFIIVEKAVISSTRHQFIIKI
jgi:hypothetical protein